MDKPKYSELTPSEKHAELLRRVRRDWQKDHPGARLFHNTSGVAYQGDFVTINGMKYLKPRQPVYFGIPEPERKRNAPKKSGGSDLLGETGFCKYWNFRIGDVFCHSCEAGRDLNGEGICKNLLPWLTCIEGKTGNAKLEPNQKIFRKWAKSVNAIYYVARDCKVCQGNQIIEKDGLPHQCGNCKGRGYTLEDE